MHNKVIVTGVNGFVGAHVVDAFQGDGFEVTGIGFWVNQSQYIAGKLANYVSCDLTDSEAVKNIDLMGVRAIIHLAGLSNVRDSFDRPLSYINDNPAMAYNLLQHAKDAGFSGRVVIVSSGALYNPHQALPINETASVLENSPYAVGKLGVEHVGNYFHLRGLDVITVRPFNHIGPNQDTGFLVPDLFAQLKSAQAENIKNISVGNLDTRRDYTDVRDIARAYKLIALADHPSYSLYNVCTGRSLAGTDILHLLQDTMGVSDIETTIDPSKVRPTDIMDIYGDASRLTDDTGWQPQIPIEQTIADFVATEQSK